MTRFSLNVDDLSTYPSAEEQCVLQSLPHELGVGYSKIQSINKHLTLIETHCNPTRNLALVNRIDASEPKMAVTYSLSGNSSYVSNGNDELVFQRGFTSISTFSSITGERRYLADSNSVQFRIVLSKIGAENLFGASHADALFTGNSLQLHSCRPTSAFASAAVRQMLNCRMAGPGKPVLLHGLALSLLAEELNDLFEQEVPIAKKFSAQDRAKATQARDILRNELQHPPTVLELARRVGTNQLKLKQLFHHFFNDTPYGMLREFRMQHAYQLLKAQQHQVSAVAELVGYRHATNFSTAFNQYYGLSPKAIAKKSH